jgi:CO dehydrogenase nickel-insertion accessory protein CooC1
MIRVANLKKGESYDLYIGRANAWLNLPQSKWANPFHLKREADRETVLAQYKAYVLGNAELLAALAAGELDHVTCGCYCAPKRCHGDILREIRQAQLHELD